MACLQNRSLKNTFWLIAAMCIAILPGCTGRSSDATKHANLTGEYRIASGERNGVAIDAKELDAIITIRDNTITAYDKERKETFAVTYTLETNRKPWQIIMISTKAPEIGVISKGLLEVDNNTVKLIYALPNGQPPTDFKTGERQQMFVLAKTDVASPNGAVVPPGT